MKSWLKMATMLLTTMALSWNAQADAFYDELGGEAGVAQIVDDFNNEISYDREIFPFFKDTNIARLRSKLIEQFCEVSGGPCTYTGDSMAEVHTGMNITSGQFNRVVELLQNALEKNDIPLASRNRLIAALAPVRADTIHR